MNWLIHEVLWEDKDRLIVFFLNRGGRSLGGREVRSGSLSLASITPCLFFVGNLLSHDDLDSIQLILDVLHVELGTILVGDYCGGLGFDVARSLNWAVVVAIAWFDMMVNEHLTEVCQLGLQTSILLCSMNILLGNLRFRFHQVDISFKLETSKIGELNEFLIQCIAVDVEMFYFGFDHLLHVQWELLFQLLKFLN